MKLLPLLSALLVSLTLVNGKRCGAHHHQHHHHQAGHGDSNFQAVGSGHQHGHAHPHPPIPPPTSAAAPSHTSSGATSPHGARTKGHPCESPGHWVPTGSVLSSIHHHLPKPTYGGSSGSGGGGGKHSATVTTSSVDKHPYPTPSRFSTSQGRTTGSHTSSSSSFSAHQPSSSSTTTSSINSHPHPTPSMSKTSSTSHTTITTKSSTSSSSSHPSPTAHTGTPGQQSCRSGTWDFRALASSAIISDWQTTTPSAAFADFIDLSGSTSTWALTSNGMELYLNRPKSSGEAALAATMSTTFVLAYGSKVTAEFQASGTGGAVTTLTMYHPDSDEIDIELPGGIYNTNYFVDGKGQAGTGWTSSELTGSVTSDGFHEYSYAWDEERMQFGFDGEVVHESLKSKSGGFWPTHGQTVQFGVWDVSASPPGTQAWGHGPIDWSKVKGDRITVTFRSLTVDCNWSS